MDGTSDGSYSELSCWCNSRGISPLFTDSMNAWLAGSSNLRSGPSSTEKPSVQKLMENWRSFFTVFFSGLCSPGAVSALPNR